MMSFLVMKHIFLNFNQKNFKYWADPRSYEIQGIYSWSSHQLKQAVSHRVLTFHMK